MSFNISRIQEILSENKALIEAALADDIMSYFDLDVSEISHFHKRVLRERIMYTKMDSRSRELNKRLLAGTGHWITNDSLVPSGSSQTA